MNNKFIFLNFSLFFFIAACCHERGVTNKYVLTDDEKSSIPYLIDQKVNFIHSNGYEFELEVANSFLENRKTQSNYCRDGYVLYEVKELLLQSNIPLFHITITRTPMEIDFSMLIVVNQTSFYIDIDRLPEKSIIIGNSIYEDVYITSNNVSDKSVIVPETVWYSKKNGIIQIQMTNDEKYTITN